VGIVPWLIGLVLVGGGLVGMFSLGRSSWLHYLPGLRIGTAEWNLYQALFDRHPASARIAALPILRFGTSGEVPECMEAQRGGAWRTRWFEGDGYGDSVEVRNLLDRAGHAIRFKKNALYKEQRRIMLTPATIEAMRAKQLESIAQELGLITPALSLTRVLTCGTDRGLHMQQEWVDDELLVRRGLRGGTLVKMGMDPTRPDAQFPIIEADSAEQVKLRGIVERAMSEAANGSTDMLAGIMDEKTAAAWALMAWVDGRDLREAPVSLVYHWSTARFSPVYQVPTSSVHGASNDPLVYNLITPLFKRPAFKARFARMQAELATAWPELQQRHAATYALWASLVNASDTAMITATHIANNAAVTHLDRVLHQGPGHATFVHGMALPPVAIIAGPDTLALAQLAKRYKLTLQGDTIIFPRGKYEINEDLEFPAGRSVVLLQGARLFMAPGRSMLVKGDLFIRGTLRNPVFIRPQDDDRPFGTLAVLGGTSQRCAISGLYVSGGVGAKLAGVSCEGMVTVQGAALTSIVNSVFQENGAAASLVVDGGEVELREVRYEGSAQRFVRLDHIRGVVRDVVMVGGRGATTGLSIGAGTVAVLGGTYTALKDAAIVADGASQVLVRRARLSQNAVVVRSAGRAEVHVEGNTVDGNDVVFTIQSDMPGDRIIVYPNHYSDNTTERSGTSGYKDVPTLDEATASLFGVALNVPENEGARTRSGRGSRRGGAGR